jgi:hypothetical protein
VFMWLKGILGFSGLLFLEGPLFRSPGRLKESQMLLPADLRNVAHTAICQCVQWLCPLR